MNGHPRPHWFGLANSNQLKTDFKSSWAVNVLWSYFRIFRNVNLAKSSRLLAILCYKTVNFNNPNKTFNNAGAISFLNDQHFWQIIIKKSCNSKCPGLYPGYAFSNVSTWTGMVVFCSKHLSIFWNFYDVNMISTPSLGISTPIYFLFCWPRVGTIEKGLKLLNFNRYVAIRRCERLIRSFHKSFFVKFMILNFRWPYLWWYKMCVWIKSFQYWNDLVVSKWIIKVDQLWQTVRSCTQLPQ